MAIEFVCPACGGALQVGDEFADRVIRCGGCMTALRVPTPDPGPPPAPASPFDSEPPAPRRAARSPTTAEPLPEEELPTAHRVDARPRRSGRRPAPPPARGNVLILLFVLGGFGLFGLLTCCGGVFFLAPSPKWHTHRSERGGFKVDLPAKVRARVEEPAGLRLEDGEKSEGAVLSLTEQYMVIYKDGPGTRDRIAKKETDAKEIDLAIDKLLKSSAAGKPRRDETMRVGGFPAREVEFHCDNGWYTVRMIVADTRVYSLIVHGVTRPADDNVRKFMDSFEITDEKLVKTGREREAEAARVREREEKRRAAEEEEQKQRADAAGKRREQEAAGAEGLDLRRAARTVTELALTAALEGK
jgi:hypothetical protein